MVSDFDIYKSASLLIDQRGGHSAKLHAAQRADEMLTKGSLAGWRKWRRIFLAIEKLSSTTKAARCTEALISRNGKSSGREGRAEMVPVPPLHFVK